MRPPVDLRAVCLVRTIVYLSDLKDSLNVNNHDADDTKSVDSFLNSLCKNACCFQCLFQHFMKLGASENKINILHRNADNFAIISRLYLPPVC